MTVRFIDIHVIQSVPPSCVNRDDTGAPKSAMYGGVRRARVSSQAWKKAARAEFENHLDRSELGVRTKRAVELIAEDIADICPEMSGSETLERAMKVLDVAKIKMKPKTGKAKNNEEEGGSNAAETNYLIFFSRAQIRQLAEVAAASDKPSAKEALAAASADNGIEVSLFGRMVADNKLLTVDAAVQVAHALSTHAAEIESDYFTAVDDAHREDVQGADMIGVVDFTSATLYRYATVNLALLEENLGDATAAGRAAQAFVRAFVLSMPTGRQNTFANRTLPEGVVITMREDQPVNGVGAFEAPVVAAGHGLVADSAKRLAERLSSVDTFLMPSANTFVVAAEPTAASLSQLAEPQRLPDVLKALGEALTKNS